MLFVEFLLQNNMCFRPYMKNVSIVTWIIGELGSY